MPEAAFESIAPPPRSCFPGSLTSKAEPTAALAHSLQILEQARGALQSRTFPALKSLKSRSRFETMPRNELRLFRSARPGFFLQPSCAAADQRCCVLRSRLGSKRRGFACAFSSIGGLRPLFQYLVAGR